MKTMIDIPDAVLRRMKARAAVEGMSMKKLLLEAIRERLESEAPGGGWLRGWRVVFGRAEPKAVAKVQAVIDAESSQVHVGTGSRS